VPGERINQAVVDYLCSGLEAGMVIPDASDATLDSFVVVS
jgi:lysine decarboxylase